jgi:hypothetical protein
MDGYLQLSEKERKTCLAIYRSARSARRALVLLLLAEGRSYREIGSAALASPSLVWAVKRDYAQGGLNRALGKAKGDILNVPFPPRQWGMSVGMVR